MKKIAIILLTIFTTTAFAYGPGHKGGERMLEHMSEKLELTDEQKGELQIIFDAQGEKMRALHDETQEKINAVLTPEQQEKMAKMKENRKKRREENKQKRQEKMEKRGK